MSATRGPREMVVGRGARRGSALIALALVLSGCRLPYVPGITKSWPSAVAHVTDATGRVVGNAVFLQERRSVRVLLDVTGLPPGTHGTHIHQVGKCEAPGFETAGAHVNRNEAQHGSANPRGPHAGDLPNLVVDANGAGHLEATLRNVSVEKKGSDTLLDADGSALVVHQGPDDLRTDPDGGSGARIACGIVVRAE